MHYLARDDICRLPLVYCVAGMAGQYYLFLWSQTFVLGWIGAYSSVSWSKTGGAFGRPT